MAIYDVLVWDLSQINVTGAKDYPFPNNATGERTSDVAGAVMTIDGSAAPQIIEVQDNDSIFGDGDTSQNLANDTTLNGVFESAGKRFTPEYAYSIRDVATDEVITIYSVELKVNKQVAIVSDSPLTAGASYEFIERVDTHPDIAYADLADTAGDGGNPGGSNGVVNGTDGDDKIELGYTDTDGDAITDAADAVAAGSGNDYVNGAAGDDVIYGDNAGAGSEKDGDDKIVGGAGADTMFGEGGNDTFIISSASDANGDTVIGGNGPDDKDDYDVLDLRGAGQVTVEKREDDTDYGSYTGTVMLENGAKMYFSQIEEILTDDQTPDNQDPVAVDDVVEAVLANDQKVSGDLSVLLGNDYDPDGDAIMVTSIDEYSSLGAKLELYDSDGDGEYDSVSYDPTGSDKLAALADGETATDTLSYTISDGNGGTSTATVTLTIAGSGNGNGGGSTDNEVADIADETQYLTGTAGNDIFVIDGVSSDYNWGTFTEDNGLEGAVVWNLATGVHDILYDFDQIRFNDQTVDLDGSGNGGNGGSTEGLTVENIVGEVQYLQGTDQKDTFIIDGNSSDFTWSTFTEDNGLEGTVIWNTATGDHDILYSFEAIQFNDKTVDPGAADETDPDPVVPDSELLFVTVNVDEVQYLQGTDQIDIFLIEGNSADYAWGTFTEDDGTEGTVVWNKETGNHDVMYAFEQIQFDDQVVVLEDTPAS